MKVQHIEHTFTGSRLHLFYIVNQIIGNRNKITSYGLFLFTRTELPQGASYRYLRRFFFKVIRPYSILIAKFMEKLYVTTLCPCMCHKTIQYNGIVVYC